MQIFVTKRDTVYLGPMQIHRARRVLHPWIARALLVLAAAALVITLGVIF